LRTNFGRLSEFLSSDFSSFPNFGKVERRSSDDSPTLQGWDENCQDVHKKTTEWPWTGEGANHQFPFVVFSCGDFSFTTVDYHQMLQVVLFRLISHEVRKSFREAASQQVIEIP
jgi:hypothetical protein